MKVKMKVKHLVLIMIGILLFIPVLTLVILPNLELYLAEKKIAAGKVEAKEEILELLKTSSVESKKWDMIQKYMIENGAIGQFDIYVSPSFTMGGPSVEDKVIRFTKEEKIPFLEDYVENGPVDGFLASAAKVLSFIYQSNGEYEKAKEVLYHTSQRLYPPYMYDRKELLMERIQLTKSHGQYDEANHYLEELLDQLDEHYPDIVAQIAQIKAEIILQQGNVNLALKEVKKAIQEYEEAFEKEMEGISESEREDYDSIENRVYYQSLKSLERSLSIAEQGDKSGKLISISGKVIRSDGTPMTGVGVFLRDENNANRSVSPEDTFQVITDNEGHFEFDGVVPNNYQITLGLYAEQINGWTWPVSLDEWIEVDGSEDMTYDIVFQKLIEIKKPVNEKVIKNDVVQFEWEAVKDAAYYNIGFGFEIEGGSIGTGFINGIKNTKVDVPIEDIYNLNGGISSDEDGVVDPVSLMAYTNPENRFHWNVDAYDEKGKLITKSSGYRLDEKTIGNLPFFYLKERELIHADLLLLDYKTEDALEEYMANYETNSNDLHSLRMITRLIGLEEESYRLQEKEEVIPYLEDLAVKSPSTDTINRLIMYYYSQNKWEDFHKWHNLYLDLNKELNSYGQSIYASALMKQRRNEEATIQFKEAMEKDGSNRFVGHWIANELYRIGLKEAVIQIANKYPYHPYGEENSPNWVLLLNDVMAEANQVENYEQELQKVLEMFFSGNEEGLENWLNSTDKEKMKKLIEQIKKVR